MNTVLANNNLEVLITDSIIISYPPLESALMNWADATTDPTSDRRGDLLHDKKKAVSDFFEWICKPVHEISPRDVKSWQIELEKCNLAPATIYGKISRISSFYEWLMKSTEMAGWVVSNPVTLARPKAPKAYQSDSTKALEDDQIRAIIRQIKSRDDVVGTRDYALFLFYMLTGLRRNEIAQLRWKDINLNGGIYVTYRAKGGDIINREMENRSLRDALLDYLDASGRLADIHPDSPLWIRHDRAGKSGNKLSSHAISKNFKRYANLAGIDYFHLHRFRHTFARIVAEESGSIKETQEALGHKNLATTRIYVQKIGIQKDKFSTIIARRLIE